MGNGASLAFRRSRTSAALDVPDQRTTNPSPSRKAIRKKSTISLETATVMHQKAHQAITNVRENKIKAARLDRTLLRQRFDSHADRRETEVALLSRDAFGVLNNLLELGHDEASLDHLFTVLDRKDLGGISFQDFDKAVRRGHFLKHVLVNSTAVKPYDIPSNYNWKESTNFNYSIGQEDAHDFVGEFADIRSKLDYSYHAKYTSSRQLWQDQVIKSVVAKTKAQTQPWIVYTCGPMGAGKGYALSWMSSHGYFPLEGIVHIDPDHFKSQMAEWDGYVTRAQKETDIEPGSLCHRESGFMQEIAKEVALNEKQNIWVDGSLKDGEWFSKVFTSLRQRYPEYRIGIFYVYASESIIRSRIKEREEETGRGVPEAALKASLEAPDRSLGILMPLVDFVARINNNDHEPRLDAFESVDRSGNWGAVGQRFGYTQPAVSDFPHMLAPLQIKKVDTLPYDAFELTPDVRDKLLDYSHKHGGYKVNILSDVMIRKGTSKCSSFKQFSVTFSPAFPVTGDTEMRRLALIPGRAFSYVFCYSVTAFLELQEANYVHDDAKSFFTYGGFIYFDLNQRIVGLNTIEEPGKRTGHMLHFGPSCILDNDESEAMMKDNKNHFYPVTLEFMLKSGATHYAWVPPGSTFGSRVRNYYGGFVYLFKSGSGHRHRIFPIING